MIETYIYTGVAFLAGFFIAWAIRTSSVWKLKKTLKSTEGYLESEKLMKETLQKENTTTYQLKEHAALDFAKKLKKSNDLNRRLYEDILLLQKSNEETDALLKTGEPALFELKLKLIEAQNVIARYKAQFEMKQTTQ